MLPSLQKYQNYCSGKLCCAIYNFFWPFAELRSKMAKPNKFNSLKVLKEWQQAPQLLIAHPNFDGTINQGGT